MTVYFAPPGEPIDGDNWQELGYVSEDGLVTVDETDRKFDFEPQFFLPITTTVRFTKGKRQHRTMLKLMFPGMYRFGRKPLIHNGKKPR